MKRPKYNEILNTFIDSFDNGGWTEKYEEDLYFLCEELNSNGIRFAISNVFENKGTTNTKLIEWCCKMNLRDIYDEIHYLNRLIKSCKITINGLSVTFTKEKYYDNRRINEFIRLIYYME